MIKEPVHKQHEHSSHIFTLAFRIGEWKLLLHGSAFKMFIAKALTLAESGRELKHAITGYLITEEYLYLVLHVAQRTPEMFCDSLDNHLRDLLRIHFRKDNEEINLDDKLKQLHLSRQIITEDLFVRVRFRDDQLVRLITGQKVELPYYDPQLELLKQKIHESAFCSALDYKHGKGPVPVHFLGNKFWMHYYEGNSQC